tara:strand:+ start:1330 stop:2343 length:1014 start_codon:yes stop_codon:yes gene_type:complete
MAVNKPNITLPTFKRSDKEKEKRKKERAALKAKLAEDKLAREKAREDRKNDLKNIENNNPDKPKGLAALKVIIQEEGLKLALTMAPSIIEMIKKMGLEKAQDLVGEYCPPQELLERQIPVLQGIVDDLNATVERIDKVAKIGGTANDIAAAIQIVATVINTVIPVVSGAAKAVPLIPGVIVSALDDLDYIQNKILIAPDGSPRLPKITGSASAIVSTVGLVSSIILRISNPLIQVIDKLKSCLPDQTDLIPTINPLVLEYAALGENNFEEKDPISYNGFIIEIEEVPFTPTVNRYRAIGYNSYGIPLIKGELSFTPNNSVLVNELKFIIDRDNLSSY